MALASETYEFSNNWFSATGKNTWDQLIPQINPGRILEIGSYEGASTCYLIDSLSPRQALEIHCVDTWQGGIEHQANGNAASDMPLVESRFLHNTSIAIARSKNKTELVLHKGFSDVELSKLLASGKQSYFDFVYVDGSHQAPDVLLDAIMSFKLLRVGGLIAFDDYLWNEQLTYGVDPIRSPKIAIDAFVNIYCRKIKLITAPLLQLYVQKISE